MVLNNEFKEVYNVVRWNTLAWHDINVFLQNSKRSKSPGPVFCATHVASPKPRRENIMIGVTN
jgi:hypothetical protein